MLKRYLTNYFVTDTVNGEIKEYAGPDVLATSQQLAQRALNAIGLDFVQVLGYLVESTDFEGDPHRVAVCNQIPNKN